MYLQCLLIFFVSFVSLKSLRSVQEAGLSRASEYELYDINIEITVHSVRSHRCKVSCDSVLRSQCHNRQ